MRRLWWLLLILPCAAGCAERAPAVLRVPELFASIQEAVDSAEAGDTVLVSPGVYREQVDLATPDVVLRGTDRAGVVVDGELRRSNGIVVTAPGVRVENLTVRNALFTGLLLTGVTDEGMQRAGGGDTGYGRLDLERFPALSGFQVSGVTAYSNGMSGIYAFDARDGVIERSYASGHPDSGIYVGRCRPCRITVRDSLVERNAVGIEVTNASEGVEVLGNQVRRNRVGITVNSEALESLAPQQGARIAGNTVTGNAEAATPAQADGGFGLGIAIGGGNGNLVERNRVSGHPRAGILVAAGQGFQPEGNQVKDNSVSGNGHDLLVMAGRTNCVRARSVGACLPLTRPPRWPPAPPGVPFTDVPGPEEAG